MPGAARKAVTTALLSLALALAAARAQETLYRLPGASATVEGDAVTVSYGGQRFVYVSGLGWADGEPFGAPVIAGNDVLVDAATLEALGVTTPRVEAVRTSGDAEVRIVLDVPALDPGALAGLRGQGSVGEGEPLELRLPPLVLPAAQPEELAGVELSLVADGSGTTLRLAGPAFAYEYFVLEAPTRVVVDVVPRRVLAAGHPRVQRRRREQGAPHRLAARIGRPRGHQRRLLRHRYLRGDRLPPRRPRPAFPAQPRSGQRRVRLREAGDRQGQGDGAAAHLAWRDRRRRRAGRRGRGLDQRRARRQARHGRARREGRRGRREQGGPAPGARRRRLRARLPADEPGHRPARRRRQGRDRGAHRAAQLPH